MVERSSTDVGSAAPLGCPFWKVISAWPDSVLSALLSVKLKVGLNPSASSDKTASAPADTAANRTGCAATDRPMARNRVASGSTVHFFDGQAITRGPTTATSAGTSVSAASTAIATAIASAGPIERKMLSDDSTIAMNAMITAPPAEAIASPARSTACDTACRLSNPSRRPSRYLNRKKRM